MLAKLFGKKTDHPMADLKIAQGLINDLPKHDPFKSLMELSDWMESVANNTDFKLEHQFAVARLLDEASYAYRRKLSREYFSALELPQFLENRLWLVLGSWYRNTFEAYFKVFQRYCEGEKGSAAIKSSLPLLVGRAVRILSAHLKYSCVHYGPVDNKIWIRLGLLYKHAERQEYLATPVTLYTTFPRQTSVKREVAKLLGWHGCGVASLSPLAMHLTEHIIAQYIQTLDVTAQPSPKTLFGFDLNAVAPPHRVNIDTTVHPYMRFVDMAGMSEKLEQLIKVLNKNIIPDDLVLGGDYDPELVKEAALYLLEFVTSPPQRRAARRLAKVQISVVKGYNKALECMAEDDPYSNKISDWKLGNISATGFYAILPQRGNETMRIGELLAIQPEGLSNWGIAMVSRLMRDEESLLHVGADILASHTSIVTLRSSIGGARLDDEQSALWLHSKAGEEESNLVCLLVANYMPNSSFHTALGGKKYLLIPQSLKYKHQDCDRVEFRFIEQDDSDE